MRTLFIFVVVTLGAGLASAQSLGEVARRDQQRRTAVGKRARVLTNEDFQRPRILEAGPQESPPLPASSYAAPPRLAAPEVPLWKVAEQPGFSLGEYVRRLREQRAATSAEPQLAAAPDASTPAVPAAGSAAELSLGEYARRLRTARQSGANTPPAAPTPDSILVHRGDSLWKLSSAHLGEGKLWLRLWKANPQLRNPDLIYPGQLLRVPAGPVMAGNREQAPGKDNISSAALSAHRLLHRTGAEGAEGTQSPTPAATIPLCVALRSLGLSSESCGFDTFLR